MINENALLKTASVNDKPAADQIYSHATMIVMCCVSLK